MDDYSPKAKVLRRSEQDSPDREPGDPVVETSPNQLFRSKQRNTRRKRPRDKHRRSQAAAKDYPFNRSFSTRDKARRSSSEARRARHPQKRHHLELRHRWQSDEDSSQTNYLNELKQPEPDTSTEAHHSCVWEPNNRPHAHPQIFFRGIGYCSLSEAALAMLLEYFIPGFEIVLGKTFQVPIGDGRSVDFCINGLMVEYHQIRLFPSRGKCGDFRSEEEFREYRRLTQRVRGNPHKKHLLDTIIHQRLKANYYTRRRTLLDQSPYFARSELVVATSRDEFFDEVIRRFALIELPSRAQFTGMFWQMVKVIAAANAGNKKKRTA